MNKELLSNTISELKGQIEENSNIIKIYNDELRTITRSQVSFMRRLAFSITPYFIMLIMAFHVSAQNSYRELLVRDLSLCREMGLSLDEILKIIKENY